MASVLFSAMKNEAPFILEWVAYHRVIGFDRIVVVSNDSDDGSTELLDALDAAGAISHILQRVPPGQSPQGNAARLSYERKVFSPGDWAIWLDGDEFLTINVGDGRTDDLIAAAGNFSAVLLQWRVFGDNAHQVFPGRFVSGDFTQCGAQDVERFRRVKTFFQVGPTFPGLSGRAVHRPKIAVGEARVHERVATPSGRPIDPNERVHRPWLRGREEGSSCFLPAAEAGYDLAQVNHYAVRTPDLYGLKGRRGRGYTAGTGPARHDDSFYVAMNASGAEDRRILRHEDATSREIARLLAIPAVERAANQAAIRVALALQGETAATPAHARGRSGPSSAMLDWLKDIYASAEIILEYGTGTSTPIAARSGAKAVFAVESDPAQALAVLAALEGQGAVKVIYERIGAVGPDGYPTDRTAMRLYPRYAAAVWDRPDFRDPDVVLINGPFRAACLATAALRASKPLRAVFADYPERSQDHWLEHVVGKPECREGAALFAIEPGAVQNPSLTRILESYLMPA